MLRGQVIQPVEKPGGFRAAPVGRKGEDQLNGRPHIACLSAGLVGLALVFGFASAYAQGVPSSQSPPWLDAALLPPAQAEGSLIVYSSTNEQEGLPLFKLFTDA